MFGGENVRITSDTTNTNTEIYFNGVQETFTTATNNITVITVNGDSGTSDIDLNDVNVANGFTAISSISVTGGRGSDTIIGTEFADTLIDSGGSDSIDGLGGNGNDIA